MPTTGTTNANVKKIGCMRKPSKKTLKAKCDKLYSELMRSFKECEAEGWEDIPCSPRLDWAHVNSRKYSAVRHSSRNSLALCARHHRHFHDFPRQFSRFITQSPLQEWYDEVYQLARTPAKVNYEQRYAELLDIKQRVETGKLKLLDLRKRNL